MAPKFKASCISSLYRWSKSGYRQPNNKVAGPHPIPYKNQFNVTILNKLPEPILSIPWSFINFRCCQKLLKGAIPVPGPIKMHGSEGSSGKWKERALNNLVFMHLPSFVNFDLRSNKSIERITFIHSIQIWRTDSFVQRTCAICKYNHKKTIQAVKRVRCTSCLILHYSHSQMNLIFVYIRWAADGVISTLQAWKLTQQKWSMHFHRWKLF